MCPPNQIQQIGEPDITRRRQGPNPVRKTKGRLVHLFRDATKPMHSPSHTRHHQRNPGNGVQMNPVSATTGGGLVLPSPKSMSVRRGPSPVRSVKEQGDHLFNDATHSMPLLPSNPTSQRHGRTGAQPNPIREVNGGAGHLFHASITQPMHALTHSNSQGPKPIRSAKK